jgi:hypothetical protein
MTAAPNPEIASQDMTLRQYAAIKLKVPDSGINWLDEMITKSLRDDFAAKAMSMKFGPSGSTATKQEMASHCYEMADAMMEARK